MWANFNEFYNFLRTYGFYAFQPFWPLKPVKNALKLVLEVLLEVVLEVLQLLPELLSAWFIRNFQKTLKRLVLALPKSCSIFNKAVRCTEEFRIRNLGQSCL